jgi:hypothetical protein
MRNFGRNKIDLIPGIGFLYYILTNESEKDSYNLKDAFSLKNIGNEQLKKI